MGQLAVSLARAPLLNTWPEEPRRAMSWPAHLHLGGAWRHSAGVLPTSRWEGLGAADSQHDDRDGDAAKLALGRVPSYPILRSC